MSAECFKHGCHMTGHEFSEGGLRCPLCDLEEVRAERDRLREQNDGLALATRMAGEEQVRLRTALWRIAGQGNDGMRQIARDALGESSGSNDP